MKHVVHLTSVHDPFDTRIFIKECKSLRVNGYKVTLIVPCDKDEIIDGIILRSVPIPKSRLERMTRTAFQIYRRAKKEKADIYHFHDPELIPWGLALKLAGKTVIYDVHEDFPRQIMDKHWLRTWVRKPISILAGVVEFLAGIILDGIIAATPTIKKRFSKNKTKLVQNFPITIELLNENPTSFKERKPYVIYVGGISITRGIKEMVDAIALLPDEARLILGGNFESDDIENMVKKLPGWSKVDYRGWVSRTEYRSLLSQCVAGLVLFHPIGNHINAQPNKLFEYMSAGLPVIASDFPLWREFIEKNKCGLLVNPFDSNEIMTAIRWILNHPEEAELMGKHGQQAVLSIYNWSNEEKKLLQYYAEVLNGCKSTN